MTFTISAVSKSLADYLAPYFSGVTFYEDPNQQDSRPPMLFLQQRYAYIQPRRQSGYFLRRIGLELTYLLDYNLPNLQQLYQQAAESLDLVMETFPYSHGKETALLRTYDREWRVDLDAMHYKFELQVWVSLPKDEIPMQSIQDYSEVIKD
jgi:hypothetical protein